MRAWVDLVTGLAGANRLWDEGFQLGDQTVRWIHVTDLVGAHMGAFRGMRMSEAITCSVP